MAKKSASLKSASLIGPLSVGKGFAMCKLGEEFPNFGRVLMGDHFRSLRRENPEFEKLYGKIMDDGELLPDEVVTLHGSQQITRFSLESGVVKDGLYRTAPQVFKMNQMGLLGLGDEAFILHASESTCRERQKIRIERSGSAARFDEKKFDKRFRIYKDNLDGVLEAFKKIGVIVRHLDANQPLESLATDVVAHVSALFEQKPVIHKQRLLELV